MRFVGFGFLLTLLLSSTAGYASEETVFELGARGGVSDHRNNEEYTAGEIYFLKELPWQAALTPSVTLGTRFDASVTILEAVGEHSAMLAIGGDLFLSFLDDHLKFEIGLRPTWLHDYSLGDDDYGGQLQFTSHAGLSLAWEKLNLSYRFQHTSNAGIYNNNPGLNLHLVGLGCRF